MNWSYISFCGGKKNVNETIVSYCRLWRSIRLTKDNHKNRTCVRRQAVGPLSTVPNGLPYHLNIHVCQAHYDALCFILERDPASVGRTTSEISDDIEFNHTVMAHVDPPTKATYDSFVLFRASREFKFLLRKLLANCAPWSVASLTLSYEGYALINHSLWNCATDVPVLILRTPGHTQYPTRRSH